MIHPTLERPENLPKVVTLIYINDEPIYIRRAGLESYEAYTDRDRALAGDGQPRPVAELENPELVTDLRHWLRFSKRLFGNRYHLNPTLL